jgi:hypothetical protein
VTRHISLTTIWSTVAAMKAPKYPPNQSPMDEPIRMDMNTSSGLTFTVRLITTGFSARFSSGW